MPPWRVVPARRAEPRSSAPRPAGRAPFGDMGVVGRGGDRQDLADRLDPMRPTMIVDEGDHGLNRRSSSRRKIRACLAQDLIGLPSSRFSRSRAFSFSAISVGTPVRCPLPISAFLTHSCNVCGVQPIFDEIEQPPPSARHARPRAPEPSEPHGSGLQVRICSSSSCLSWLHLLKSWSLRQSRGGSDQEAIDTVVSPKSKLSKPLKKPQATWVEPSFMTEVEYRDITSEGLLRQSSFKGLTRKL